MSRRPNASLWLTTVLCISAIVASPLLAAVVPDNASPVAARHHRDASLDIQHASRAPAELPAQAAARAFEDLAALGVPAGTARVDQRGGGWAMLMPSTPLVPGKGVGNNLKAQPTDAGLKNAAWQAFGNYVRANQAALRLDAGELAAQGTVTVHRDGEVVQINAPRTVNGYPVLGSYLHAVVNSGNLVLFGANNWGRVTGPTSPRLTLDEAIAAAQSHLGSIQASGWAKPQLAFVPTANGADPNGVALGQGYNYRLSWLLTARIPDEGGTWRATVDSITGDVMEFADQNLYAESRGGVLPVTNDPGAPGGTEQAGWPMPFDIISTAGGNVTTDSGGNFTPNGNGTSNLAGQFVRMNDNCGAISLTSSGDIDFGTSPGTDCQTPGIGGAGNTHASRSGFHEINRIAEMARGQLPVNGWLQNQLTSNMNINSSCNAFWNGATVNFYRSGGGCANTGELAGVFDHEWGHGMDANDANPGISSPGEGIADIYTALRLFDSCIGWNFRPGINCGGYGDPCIDCTGVRDIDFTQRASGNPHTFSWANGNPSCGSVHCRGAVYSEAAWNMWHIDLAAAPFSMDRNTAAEVVTRMTYIGGGAVGTWFSGSPPNGGCSATNGYPNYLAADDDNGNVNDGTPHMTAVFAAFDRQEIACGTPTVQNSGCPNTPTDPPIVTGTPFDKAATLSWDPITDAVSYGIYRTDSLFGCDFGKVKVAEVAGTSFNDSGLQNGRQYSYVVIPMGPNGSCFGPGSSCTTVQPAAGPNLDIDAASAALSIAGGDGDAFIDNCETGTLTFDINNTGLGGLTNVQIVGVTSSSHPTLSISNTSVSPANVPEGGSTVGSFDFTSNDGSLSFGDTVILTVEVTATELAANKTADLTVTSAESDVQLVASTTFSFESDTEGWTVEQGTFNRSNAIGGGGGTSWAIESSNGLHNQCDRIRSPLLQLTASSTLSLDNNFDIEPFSASTWYDRANVGIIDGGGARTLITPDSGRLYNADSNGPGNFSGCNDPEEGWAATAASWASSGWSSAALQAGVFAGQSIRLEVIYATDPALANRGFSFDQVTVTDALFLVADTQSDDCGGGGCTSDIDCDNGLFCDGAETCNLGTGSCEAGTAPDCDDGVSCTVDNCNEATDSCDSSPNDSLCTDGLFCNGTETCDAGLGCQAGTAPNCDDGIACTADSCNEGNDSCDNTPNDAVCDNGTFCDGAEVCTPGVGCEAGAAPSCDDGVGCTIDSCNAGTDSCDNVADDTICDNGLFCDGTEFCDAINDCQGGAPVCTAPGETCDEANDVCVTCAPKGDACVDDADCCSNKCRGRTGNKSCK